MMSRETEAERSFVASLGPPELVHHRTIPKDIFYRHKRLVHNALRSKMAQAVRSHSVRTPVQHMRVDKDYDSKYEDLYKNNAAKLRESRCEQDSANSSFAIENRTPMKPRSVVASSRSPSNASFRTCRSTAKVMLMRQSENLIAHICQTINTEKENTSDLVNKCKITRQQDDPADKRKRGSFSEAFVRDALADYKETEKKLFIHTNAGGNFRHRVISRRLKELSDV